MFKTKIIKTKTFKIDWLTPKIVIDFFKNLVDLNGVNLESRYGFDMIYTYRNDAVWYIEIIIRYCYEHNIDKVIFKLKEIKHKDFDLWYFELDYKI